MSSAITAVVVAGAGAYASYKSSKKSSKAQAAANEAQRKINRLKNKQAKRQYLRNFRQAQADVFISAIAAGVGLESSAFRGTRASHTSQAQTALREFKEFDDLGAEYTGYMNSASRHAAKAQTWGAVSSFAQSFISAGSFAELFKKGQ